MRAGPLELTPMSVDAVDELWPLLGDPRLWAHEPGSVHADPAATRRYLTLAAERWASGLSYWTVRLADTGEVVGTGGAQHHTRGGADHWNLNYRIAPAHQGHGYAGLLLASSLDAAHAVAPDRPCVAWIDAHNPASIAVARRGGLRDLGLRRNPSDRPRLAWSDRDLDATVYPLVEPG
ncbi:GNAT family N-acetyltransferase [uncultured Nocardioides sp.]|uniref:GNAT family N-acetyltransferase n=1 Tax=uncultured Nocardioides sp. TaxID=198441 RepID=UPI00262CB657|nr:GNAT family N-acetyltransferase [uncultured Nocardioides sp.]